MSRLPIPGQDKGSWGDVLNDFLSQSLNGDGTIKTGVVTATKLDTTTQTNLTKASTSVQIGGDLGGNPTTPTVSKLQGTTVNASTPSNNQVLQYSTSSQAWVPGTVTSTTVTDATTGAKGIVQLAGDLAGTASAPTVPGLALKAPLASPTFTGTVTVPTPSNTTDAATKAYVDSSVTSGAVADATTSSKGKVQLAGDLGGSAAAPSVLKINNVAVSGAPTSGQVITASSATAAAWTTPASAPVTSVAGKAGVVTLVEGDIANLTTDLAAKATDTAVVHNTGAETIAGAKTFSTLPTLPATAPTNATDAASKSYVDSTVSAGTPDATSSTKGKVMLTGDFGGTAGAPLVAKLQTTPLSASVPTSGQVLQFSGGAWTPGTVTSTTVSDATTGAKGIVQLTNDFSGTATAPQVVATHLAAALPLAQGGTGSTTQNFVDLTTTQSIAGAKSFTGTVVVPTPTANTQAATKAYVDSAISTGAGSSTLVLTPTATKTAAYTAAAQDLVLANATSAAFTVTLPTAPADTTQVEVKKLDSSANIITVATAGSDTYAIGGTTIGLAIQGQAVTFRYQTSTSKWIAISNDLPLAATDARYLQQTAAASTYAPLASPTFTGTVTVPTPVNTTDAATKTYVDSQIIGGTTPAATTTTQGKVKLANDFSGTADLPTVVATHLTAALPINQGGTGSQTQNFVDLTTAQTVAGNKTLSGTTAITGTITVPTPTIATQAATKAYVDSATGTSSTSLTANTVQTASFTATANTINPIDASSAALTVTLPTTPADKSRIVIKKIDASANTVTVATGGSDVLNKTSGTTSFLLQITNQASTLQYVSATGIWYVLSDDLPSVSVPLGVTKVVSAAYTLLTTDHVLLANAGTAAFTVTLPTAVGYFGRFTVTETSGSSTSGNYVTLATTSSQLISGAATTTVGSQASGAAYSSVDVVSDGANWRIV